MSGRGAATGPVALVAPAAHGTWSGFGRYTTSLRAALEARGIPVRLVVPGLPSAIRALLPIARRVGLDLERFFTTYPLGLPPTAASLYHLSVQQMALLLRDARLRPAVVTVHDIGPYLLRAHPILRRYSHPVEAAFDAAAVRALRRADLLLAVSLYTASTVTRHLGIPADRIVVVPEAVDRAIFRPRAVTDEVRARFGLRPDETYVLSVGSDLPTKNLTGLVGAVARVRSHLPRVRLLKVGPSLSPGGAAAFARRVAECGLGADVRDLGRVSEDELVALYNAADLFVFPSLYEGFGLPLLEAMACGTPVVSSDRCSLPEVAGDAALLVDPADEDALAAAMLRVLSDADLRQTLRRRGQDRASEFTWDRTAAGTAAAYERARAGR